MTDRIDGMISHFGEDFTITGVTHRGVFSNMTTGNARAYLTFAEVDTITLPIWSCIVASSDTSIEGDFITWNGLSLMVRKIAQARFQGSLVGKMLILG